MLKYHIIKRRFSSSFNFSKALNVKNRSLLQTKSFIDNEWVNNSETLNVYNPANGQIFGKVAMMNDKQILNAIESTTNAFNVWKNYSLRKKIKNIT